MTEESRPSEVPPEDEPIRPDEPSPADSTADPDAATTRRSFPVLILGFIGIALLGSLIFHYLIPPPKVGTAADSPALQSLKADIETQRQMLNRERLALGLEPIGGSSQAESADAVAARVKEDAATLASLVTSFQDLLARKDSQLAESRAETVASLKERQRLRERLDTLNSDLRQAMIDGSMASTLKSDLDQTEAQLDVAREELARLRDEPAQLRRQLAESNEARAELGARVTELESQLARSSLFAGTEQQMFTEAAGLFRSLRELEGKSESEISSAYSRFGASLGANVLKTCSFESGSSEITSELESAILSIPGEAPDDALILVVGYASDTGDSYNNRSLSSSRATAVARIINASKQSGQNVQAVYLGETNRFSADLPEQNQIVEVWQLTR